MTHFNFFLTVRKKKRQDRKSEEESKPVYCKDRLEYSRGLIKRWPIGTDVEKESRESVQSPLLDNDNDDDDDFLYQQTPLSSKYYPLQ